MEHVVSEPNQNTSTSSRSVASETPSSEGSLNLILNKIGDLKKQLTTEKSESPAGREERARETNGEQITNEIKELKRVVEEKDKRIEELRLSFSQLQDKFSVLQAGKGKRDEECKYLTRELDVARLLVSQLEYEKRREDESREKSSERAEAHGSEANSPNSQQDKKTDEEEEADREVEEERFNRVMREMEIERCRRQELEEEVEKLKEEIQILRLNSSTQSSGGVVPKTSNDKLVLDRSELESLSQVIAKMENVYKHSKSHEENNRNTESDESSSETDSDSDEDSEEEEEENEAKRKKREAQFNFSKVWPLLPSMFGPTHFFPQLTSINSSTTPSSVDRFLLPPFQHNTSTATNASLPNQLFNSSSPFVLPLPPPPPLLPSLPVPSIPPPLSPHEFFSLFSTNLKAKNH